MTQTAIVIFVLSLSTLEAMSASNCDQALKAAASHLRPGPFMKTAGAVIDPSMSLPARR